MLPIDQFEIIIFENNFKIIFFNLSEIYINFVLIFSNSLKQKNSYYCLTYNIFLFKKIQSQEVLRHHVPSQIRNFMKLEQFLQIY